MVASAMLQVIRHTDMQDGMAVTVRQNVNEIVLRSHFLLGCAAGSLDFARDDQVALPFNVSRLTSHKFKSRHRQSRENALYNSLARNRLRFRFVANDDAVTQNIGTDALDVLRCNVAASI
jgi:hypothetical protein